MTILFKPLKYGKFGKLLSTMAVLNGHRSQSELAHAIRSNTTHIHSILTGKAKPNAKFMKKLKLNLTSDEKEWKKLYDEALKLNGWETLK